MSEKLPFVGRKRELRWLEEVSKRPEASLVVIRGRRRIGKSRLVAEFAKNKKLLRFSGLPPEEGVTAIDQRAYFVTQLTQQLGAPKLASDDWADLFFYLAQQVETGNYIILFDEISWMAQDDPTFLPKLKDYWDEYFKRNNELMLILCGSVSLWIEKNILSSTGFLGRVSEKITLGELSIHHVEKMMDARNIQCSAMDKLIAMSITGGVPWYVELLGPGISIMANIKRLCFHAGGVLVGEFKHIFHDLFQKRADVYKRIVMAILKTKSTQSEIAAKLNYSNSAQLGEYLEDLEAAGFIAKDYAWTIKTGKVKAKPQFRLKDNYLRFYLKYIEPQLAKIEKGDYLDEQVNIENFSGIVGLQFENVVLNNRNLILESLGLSRNDIVFDNPYFQKPTKLQQGCQVDYLIQTNTNALILCEVKFSRREIGTRVIEEVQNKIDRLKLPKRFSCLPVLIHVSGVTEELEDEKYFYKIIDFGQFLS